MLDEVASTVHTSLPCTWRSYLDKSSVRSLVDEDAAGTSPGIRRLTEANAGSK